MKPLVAKSTMKKLSNVEISTLNGRNEMSVAAELPRRERNGWPDYLTITMPNPYLRFVDW
jgi:hypothetical protein